MFKNEYIQMINTKWILSFYLSLSLSQRSSLFCWVIIPLILQGCLFFMADFLLHLYYIFLVGLPAHFSNHSLFTMTGHTPLTLKYNLEFPFH